ncbi:MAG: flagellar hook protein FlgE [Methylovirgula sp.]
MSLFSAMMASVSGMQAQANMLSTISDNIANSDTTGYKQATASFEDMLSQASTTSYSAAGVATTIGYGISTQGELASATSATDLAIQGNGFFVVQDASGNTYLTRAGDFSPNVNGELVNSEGYTLMGYPITSTSNSPPGSVSQLTPITISTAGRAPTATTSGTFTANLPSTDAIDTGTLPSANTAASTYSEKSSFTTYDDLGAPVTLDVYFTQTGANTWEADVYNAADAASGGGFPYSTAALTTQTLTFSGTTGDLTGGSPLTFTVPNGQAVSVDLSNMTQNAASFTTSMNTMNGNAPAAYSSISIGTDGTVSEVYSDGTTQAIAGIPLGTVASVDSLTPHAGQTYSANPNSGDIVLGTASQGGFGTVNSNELESSTVDLATELTNMVVAQNSYSANSKAFQTGSDMVTTLINMLK